VPRSTLEDAEARRTYRHALRTVARLLRWAGMALVLLGTVGIALGHDGAWFTGPSWVSFVIGWALILSGVVRRVERSGVAPDE
jgi:membrane protein YdbS with pleckstrin-like domain